MAGISYIKSAENAAQRLQGLATLAYGSGNEAGKAGSGNIGLLGGYAVKFNTHLDERMANSALRSSYSHQRACCDELRTTLNRLAEELLQGVQPEEREAVLKEIRKELGLSTDNPSHLKTFRGLLDRKTVVKVMTILGQHSEAARAAVEAGMNAAEIESTADKSTDFATQYKGYLDQVRAAVIRRNPNIDREALDDILLQQHPDAKKYGWTPQETPAAAPATAPGIESEVPLAELAAESEVPLDELQPQPATPAKQTAQTPPANDRQNPSYAHFRQPKPVAPQPKPVAPQPDPVAPQPDPVAPQPKPVAPQQDPVAPQQDPVAPQPDPPTGPMTGNMMMGGMMMGDLPDMSGTMMMGVNTETPPTAFTQIELAARDKTQLADNLTLDAQTFFQREGVNLSTPEMTLAEIASFAKVNAPMQQRIDQGQTSVFVNGEALAPTGEEGAQTANLDKMKAFFGGSEGLTRVFCALSNAHGVTHFFESEAFKSASPEATMMRPNQQKTLVFVEPLENGHYGVTLSHTEQEVMAWEPAEPEPNGAESTPAEARPPLTQHARTLTAKIEIWDAAETGDPAWKGVMTPSGTKEEVPFVCGMAVLTDRIDCHYI